MKKLLEMDYLQNFCGNFDVQPESFKESVRNRFEDKYNGKIDYIDWFGEPLIHSERELQNYLFRNGKLEKVGFKSENDLERLSLEEFNERFDGLGNKLTEEFKNKAEIENHLEIILEPEYVEKWFLSLLEDFGKEEKNQILKALDLCKKQHKGQYRDEGVEYYSHPVFVAIKGIEKGLDYKDIIVLLLHDVIEDSKINIEELKKLFGEEIAKKIYLLSRKQNGNKIINKEDYYKRISSDRILSILKGLDRLSNLYSINFSSKNKKKRYIKETKEIIIPIISKFDKSLSDEIQKVLNYIENELYSLPAKVISRLEDFKKINETKNIIKTSH